MQRLILLRATTLALLAASPASAQLFMDVTAQAGITVSPSPAVMFGRGFAVADFDGDGDPDLVVPSGFAAPILYFQNDGGGSFSDQTVQAGLGAPPGEPKAFVPADIDNDGDLDLFASYTFGQDRLFVNDGSGTFSEEAGLRGVANPESAYGASFGDFDRDGWLDLYVANRFETLTGAPTPNRLYRNDGDGTFTDVTAASGAGDLGVSLAVAVHDQDGDGWPDLFVANEKGSNPANPPNALYRNNGDGTFTDVAPALQAALGIEAMGLDIGDVFNDGGWDYYVSDVPPDHHFMVWDEAQSLYQDATATYGLQGGHTGWSVNLLDYQNDGWLDAYVVHSTGPNSLFENPGPGPTGLPWPEVGAATGASVGGFKFVTTHADLDADGDLDLMHLIPQSGFLLQENTLPGSHWLRVETRGTRSNRDGIGAVVTVTAQGLVQRRMVRSNRGFLCGHEPAVHFGLGALTSIDSLTVQWPSGAVDHHLGVAADQTFVAVESSLTVSGPLSLGGTAAVQIDIPSDAGLPYLAALSGASSPGIPLPDGRVVPLAPDALLLLTLGPLPGISPSPYFDPGPGTLDASGAAQGTLTLPALPGLQGVAFWVGALGLDPQAPSGIRSIPAAEALAVP